MEISCDICQKIYEYVAPEPDLECCSFIYLQSDSISRLSEREVYFWICLLDICFTTCSINENGNLTKVLHCFVLFLDPFLHQTMKYEHDR